MLQSFREHLKRHLPESLVEKSAEWERQYRDGQNSIMDDVFKSIMQKTPTASARGEMVCSHPRSPCACTLADIIADGHTAAQH